MRSACFGYALPQPPWCVEQVVVLVCRCSIRDYCDLENLISVYHQCFVASLEGRSVFAFPARSVVVFAVGFVIVVRVGGC